MNLISLFLQKARLQPDLPALIDGDRTVTYGELADIVRRTAGHLHGLGLRPGERVGLCLKDRWQHMALILAAGLAGLVILPMDWRARPAEKLRIAELLAPSLVALEPEDRCAPACAMVRIDSDWMRLAARAAPLETPPDDWTMPLIIGQTSGTTGTPKFSVATHLQQYFRCAVADQTFRLDRPLRFLSMLPLCFAGGFLRALTHILKGDCVVLYPAMFTADDYVDTVARQNITLAFVVPSVVRQLLRAAGSGRRLMPDLPALVCGGSPIFGEEKQEAARRITANFMEVFGTTVTGGCTRLSASDLDGRADSVGRPLDLVELEVVDDTDRVLPPDTVGRLRIRTAGIGAPLIIPGRALPSQEDVRGGWSYTGELALLDAQGYLFIKGRTSDVIMRRGAKIMPAEIEAALLQHDAVAEAAVIGLPGDGADEDITAFCVVRRPLNGAELLAHCRARLTPYKTPQRIQIVESLPRNAGGKVAKAELAKLSGRPANTP